MARRSSGGGRSARSPAPRRSSARSPAPQPANKASPPAVAQDSSRGSILGGIGSSIVDGIGFGAGNAVAHRVVDAVMGPRTIRHETAVSEATGIPAPTANSMSAPNGCNAHSKAFQDCLESSGSDISKCQFYMDVLAECRKNSGSGLTA
ncbi:hypothetical protein LINGRAHAP2_LOCUS32406 [Linum grandiflorum]